ncbi:hypothetical protein [Amycolatopsis sp. NPDC051102]|uniref:hypothetical protein n=1 Tax=Amycolatopsis sp. NPDC051102 TaxID=3155163 RepID=UPI003418200E
MAWLVRERASGREWRVGESDLAWDIDGYDATRFELHVLDEKVVGAPDGNPTQTQKPRLGSAGVDTHSVP